MHSAFGHQINPKIPDNIIKIDGIVKLLTHTPTIPPDIPTINIRDKAIVRPFVGNISEDIKFAEELADEDTKKIIHMNN